MKRADWQRIYEPNRALDMRVKNVLSGLQEERAVKMTKKRMGALVLTCALAMVSVGALAAGLLFSSRVDAQQAAAQALEAQYGITTEMGDFFRCAVEEKDGRTTATYTPANASMETRLGVYTVVIEDGKAQASWSHDGAENPGGLSSPVWSAAELEEAIARKVAGEEWYQILRDPQETAQQLIEESRAVELARAAILEKFGADALEGYEALSARQYIDTDPQDSHANERWEVSTMIDTDGATKGYVVKLRADDGAVIDCRFEETTAEQLEAALKEAEEAQRQWKETAGRLSAQAQEVAKLTMEEAEALAKQALQATYGLTQAQIEKLSAMEDFTCMTMQDGKAVAECWYALRQSEDERNMYTEGDGTYIVYVNLETGVIEDVKRMSGLAGNG